MRLICSARNRPCVWLVAWRNRRKQKRKKNDKKEAAEKKADEDSGKNDSAAKDADGKDSNGKDSSPSEKLLDRVTIYIIPRPSPDASAKCWKTLLDKPTGNGRTTDDDRDGETGEDPPNDLNGDNLITMMRVTDPLGQYRAHPSDSRILIEADPKKNEKGTYSLYSEGRDDDHDEQFNEDAGTGGEFQSELHAQVSILSGRCGTSSSERTGNARVADFCFEHQQIAIVFSFTPEDNLLHPWKPGQESGKIKRFLAKGDSPQTDFIAKHYAESVDGKNSPTPETGSGSFSDWAYFHYGRWSFGGAVGGFHRLKKQKKKKRSPKNRTERNLQHRSPMLQNRMIAMRTNQMQLNLTRQQKSLTQSRTLSAFARSRRR